jgi:uncharacterized protein (DUF1330 family)
MAGYVVAVDEDTDPEGIAHHRQIVPAIIEQFGGRFLVHGGKTEALEGDWEPSRLIIIEFPSAEQARAWWSSAEYAEAKALRQRSAKTTLPRRRRRLNAAVFLPRLLHAGVANHVARFAP